MRQFPILFLLYISLFTVNISCNYYRHMKKSSAEEGCIPKFKPDFQRAEYKIAADVIGKHISGLLLIKYMPDSSTRIVFTNEMGLSFFDFGFSGDTGFTVYHIVQQMNKPALIKTLRKDFALILFKNMDVTKSYDLNDSDEVYHAYPQTKAVNYYVTDKSCSRLVKMQRASAKKPVMEAFFYDNLPGQSPDSIFIHHLNFNFSISLKKISPIASQ
jgi:hypothetical protein